MRTAGPLDEPSFPPSASPRLQVGQGLLFGALLYWIVGLNPSAAAFFIFCCLVICEGGHGEEQGVLVDACLCCRRFCFPYSCCKRHRLSFHAWHACCSCLQAWRAKAWALLSQQVVLQGGRKVPSRQSGAALRGSVPLCGCHALRWAMPHCFTGQSALSRKLAPPTHALPPAVAPNEKLALALAPTITIVLMLFGGFYVNTATIPAVLRWSEHRLPFFSVFYGRH